MVGFSELIKRDLGETISYRYETYENYPHVPFPCLYDGLRFVTMGQPKNRADIDDPERGVEPENDAIASLALKRGRVLYSDNSASTLPGPLLAADGERFLALTAPGRPALADHRDCQLGRPGEVTDRFSNCSGGNRKPQLTQPAIAARISFTSFHPANATRSPTTIRIIKMIGSLMPAETAQSSAAAFVHGISFLWGSFRLMP